jgi:hypothetical protein
VNIGIVGAGRSRNGLGPFLAASFERAGAHVLGVAGRDVERAEANALELSQSLGHGVGAAVDVPALCRAGIDALVIASPAEHHLEALQAALEAGIACLCEKPLVAPAQVEAGLAAVRGFEERGLVLHENVQWPFVMPMVGKFYGERHGPVRRVGLGLSPAATGASVMVRDALPHLISVAQAAAGAPVKLLSAELDHDSPTATECVLGTKLGYTGGELSAELYVRHCKKPPRPAWLAIDGRRLDRRIGPGYAIEFVAGGLVLPIVDPLQQLVDRFVAAVQKPKSVAPQHRTIAERLSLYGEILQRAGA